MDFKALLKELNIDLSLRQEEQFLLYFQMLVEWNKVMNLTGITDYDGVYLKHFYDSLTLAKACDFTKPLMVCDVGSGAGFPAIPLKIAFPNLKITIVDSLNKRINFLNEVIKKLEMKDIICYHCRAEEFKERECFDVVTSRALANINIGSELCLPLVKIGGFFIPMMAKHDSVANLKGSKGITILGGEVEETINFLLAIENSERSLVKIKKIKETPKKYPRGYAAIKSSPLM